MVWGSLVGFGGGVPGGVPGLFWGSLVLPGRVPGCFGGSLLVLGFPGGFGVLLNPPIPPRYPKIMADEGLRAVREWLEAATPEEESE